MSAYTDIDATYLSSWVSKIAVECEGARAQVRLIQEGHALRNLRLHWFQIPVQNKTGAESLRYVRRNRRITTDLAQERHKKHAYRLR
jgi:hypothetical protein